MLFPWQQRIQSSSTVERSSRMSPFWKLRCPSAVPVWSHSARTALWPWGRVGVLLSGCSGARVLSAARPFTTPARMRGLGDSQRDGLLDLAKTVSGLGGKLLDEGLVAPKSRPSQLPLSGLGGSPLSGPEGAAWFLLAGGSGEAARRFFPAVGSSSLVSAPVPVGKKRSSGEEVPEVSVLLLAFGLERSGTALV